MSDLWTAAEAAASDARHMVSVGRYSGACVRAYFAMFNAARVLLRESDPTAPRLKTHASVLRMFSLKFIRNGPFEANYGEIFRQASGLRAMADYEGESISADEAREIVNAMDEFMTLAASIRSRANES